MRHSVCVHPDTYQSKPQKFAGYISAQIAKHPQDLSVEELASCIGTGKSWTPSTFHSQKRSIETFKQMSLIAVDIDTGNPSYQDLINLCNQHGIDPCIIHESFSSTDVLRKWRVVFQLEKSITDTDTAYHAIGVLAAIFKADSSCVEPARFLYGTTTDKIHLVNPNSEVILLDWFSNKQTLKVKTKKKMIKGELRSKPREKVYVSDLPILRLVVQDCKDLISDPPESRYQALWNSARKLAQLDHFTPEQIANALTGSMSLHPDVWDDWDKDPDKVITAGIEWGVNHLREDIQ